MSSTETLQGKLEQKATHKLSNEITEYLTKFHTDKFMGAIEDDYLIIKKEHWENMLSAIRNIEGVKSRDIPVLEQVKIRAFFWNNNTSKGYQAIMSKLKKKYIEAEVDAFMNAVQETSALAQEIQNYQG